MQALAKKGMPLSFFVHGLYESIDRIRAKPSLIIRSDSPDIMNMTKTK